MDVKHVYLRKFNLQKASVNTESIQHSSRLYYSLNTDEPCILLKTGDLCIDTVMPSSYVVSVVDKRDRDAIKRFDDVIMKSIEKVCTVLLEDIYTLEEIEHMFVCSLNNNNQLTICCDIGNSNTTPFNVYDPNRLLISNDRLVPDVVCRCALRPWTIEYSKRIKRLCVMWIIDHCMILEEPIYTECVLDADDCDDDNDDEHKNTSNTTNSTMNTTNNSTNNENDVKNTDEEILNIVLNTKSTKKNKEKRHTTT